VNLLHLRTTYVALLSLLLAVLMVSTGSLFAPLVEGPLLDPPAPGHALRMPPPGGLTLGLSGTTDPAVLVDAQPFEVESVFVLDVQSQQFLRYIPGAPERINTLTAAHLRPDSVVTVRRRAQSEGGGAALASGAPSLPSTLPISGYPLMPMPPPGGFTQGIAAVDTLEALVAGQWFRVASVLVFDEVEQRFLTFIPGAPPEVNTLTDRLLTPTTVVTIRRAPEAQFLVSSVAALPDVEPSVIAGTTTPSPQPTAPPVLAGAPPSTSAPAAGGGGGAGVGARPPAATSTPVPTPTRVPTAAPTRTPTASASVATPARTATAAPTPTRTPTATPTPRPTATPTRTPTPTPTTVKTPTPTPTAVKTPTPAPTAVKTPTPTPTPAKTAVPTDGCASIPNSRLGLLDDRVGFGRSTTGGADGCLYVVTNDNNDGPGSLRWAAERGGFWIVFDGDYTIDLSGPIFVKGDTTIDGNGARVTVRGSGLHMLGERSTNVIIANISVMNARGTDLLTVRDGATRFWFDHVTLSGADDEYVDIGNAPSRGIDGTVSWVRFDSSTFSPTELVFLIGDDNSPENNDEIRITMHHSFFNGTAYRHPLVTGARVHSFNNVISWEGQAVHLRQGSGPAHFVSEHDIYDASVAAKVGGPRDGLYIQNTPNHVRLISPMLRGGARLADPDDFGDPSQAFDPRDFYGYSAEAANDSLFSRVTGGAGRR